MRKLNCYICDWCRKVLYPTTDTTPVSASLHKAHYCGVECQNRHETYGCDAQEMGLKINRGPEYELQTFIENESLDPGESVAYMLSERAKTLLFEPSDFDGWEKNETPNDAFPTVSQWCAEAANHLLAERDKVRDAYKRNYWLAEILRDAPVVYASLGGFNTAEENLVWLSDRGKTHTHHARLVQIEEIKKCDHFPGQVDCMWCKK